MLPPQSSPRRAGQTLPRPTSKPWLTSAFAGRAHSRGCRREAARDLFNCFVMGPVPDDLAGIFDGVKEAALTMQQGGGIGQDFSTLRPAGALVQSIGADASGPVSFMDVWDACAARSCRRGAARGDDGLSPCRSSDIETFIAAKSDPARLRNFNVSVLVTDAFMAAVKADSPWDLLFEGKVLPHGAGAGALGQDYAGGLRLCRARRDFHRPG